MKAPLYPPSLAAMDARTRRLDEERRVLFPMWKTVLEESNGNITLAGKMAAGAFHYAPEFGFLSSMDADSARDRAQRLTKRLGLVEYAEQLRRASGGARTGRPRTKKTG